MKKVLLKHLPSRKKLKQYLLQRDAVNNENIQLQAIQYSKQGIYLNYKFIKGESYIASFYERIDGVNISTKTIVVTILPEYFEHILNAYNKNSNYIQGEFNKATT